MDRINFETVNRLKVIKSDKSSSNRFNFKTFKSEGNVQPSIKSNYENINKLIIKTEQKNASIKLKSKFEYNSRYLNRIFNTYFTIQNAKNLKNVDYSKNAYLNKMMNIEKYNKISRINKKKEDLKHSIENSKNSGYSIIIEKKKFHEFNHKRMKSNNFSSPKVDSFHETYFETIGGNPKSFDPGLMKDYRARRQINKMFDMNMYTSLLLSRMDEFNLSYDDVREIMKTKYDTRMDDDHQINSVYDISSGKNTDRKLINNQKTKIKPTYQYSHFKIVMIISPNNTKDMTKIDSINDYPLTYSYNNDIDKKMVYPKSYNMSNTINKLPPLLYKYKNLNSNINKNKNLFKF